MKRSIVLKRKLDHFFPGQHVSMKRMSIFNAENVDATGSSPYVYIDPIQLQLTSNECKNMTCLLRHRGKKWYILTLSVYPLPLTGFHQWLEI